MKHVSRYIYLSLTSFALYVLPVMETSAHHNNNHNNGPNWKKSLKVIALDQLEFGTIAPNTTLSGSVRVSARRNNASRCDPNLTCIEKGDRARFRITGRKHYGIGITVAHSAILRNQSGQTMIVDRFRYNVAGFGQGFGYLSGQGAVELGVGARLNVKANQPPGAYTGTFEVNVYYQ